MFKSSTKAEVKPGLPVLGMQWPRHCASLVVFSDFRAIMTLFSFSLHMGTAMAKAFQLESARRKTFLPVLDKLLLPSTCPKVNT